MDGLELHVGPIDLPSRDCAFLVQISVIPPTRTAVSIVLDQSDSCHEITSQLETCLSLIRVVPRSYPVWVFRLSQAEPLIVTTVADVLDGAVNVNSILKESDKDTHTRGSFLRPCIESMEVNLEGMQIICFVLTDGQLSDFGVVKIPSSMKVVGVTADEKGFDIWRKVIPDSPIYIFKDAKIDRTIKPYTQPYWGMVQVSMEGLDLRSDLAYRVTPENRLMDLAESPIQEVNFCRENAIFVLMLSLDEMKTIRINFRSDTMTNSTFLRSVKLDKRFSANMIEQVASAFSSNSESQSLDLLFDIDCGNEEFSSFRESAKTAIVLAEQNQPWVVESMLQVFPKQVLVEDFHSRAISLKCDAMLCIFGLDANDEPQRIVGIALKKHQQPAVELSEASLLDCRLRRPLRINFDKSAYRWFLKVADNPERELETYNSELLQFDIELSFGITSWKVIFSGDLAL